MRQIFGIDIVLAEVKNPSVPGHAEQARKLFTNLCAAFSA
jgi:hypothetical protein